MSQTSSLALTDQELAVMELFSGGESLTMTQLEERFAKQEKPALAPVQETVESLARKGALRQNGSGETIAFYRESLLHTDTERTPEQVAHQLCKGGGLGQTLLKDDTVTNDELDRLKALLEDEL